MYVNVSAQIVLTLEQLHNITSKTSDTPNEKANDLGKLYHTVFAPVDHSRRCKLRSLICLYSTLFAQIVLTLEQLHNITSKTIRHAQREGLPGDIQGPATAGHQGTQVPRQPRTASAVLGSLQTGWRILFTMYFCINCFF